jgi:ferritin-like metal-binding protein YciE
MIPGIVSSTRDVGMSTRKARARTSSLRCELTFPEDRSRSADVAKAKELNESAVKVVQWLNEAYAKEAELEADLTAHIALTQKASYKKRLQDHLKETREHKRAVARRIKQIGGEATTGGSSLPGVPAAVGEAAGKTVAAVKGQLGVARAMVTDQAETHVRQASEELREEHVEIALYTRIETLASEVGDKDTVQLAKRIRREEERMAKFLTAELPRLVKDVVKSEIPRDQRATTTRRRTSSRTTSRSSGGTRSASSRTASRASSASGTGSRSRSSSGSARSNGGSGSGSGSTRSSRSSTSSSSSGSSS